MSKLDDIRAQIEAEALSDAERAEVERIKAEQDAIADLARLRASKRALALAARVEQAQTTAAGAYRVEGVDLVGLFPLGKAPPLESFPSGGVVVVRNPAPETVKRLAKEVEHKAQGRDLHALLLDVLVASTVDPARNTPDHVTLQAWGAAHPEAASVAAGVVRKMGGAKLAEDKRGDG